MTTTQSYLFRKKLTLWAMIFAVLAIACVIITPLAFAAAEYDLDPKHVEQDFNHDNMEGYMSDFSDLHKSYSTYVSTVLDEIASGPLFTMQAAFGSSGEGVRGINQYFVNMHNTLTQQTGDSENGIATVATIFQAIGIFMLFIYTCINIWKMSMKMQMTGDMAAGKIVTFFAGLLICMYGDKMVSAIALLGQTLLDMGVNVINSLEPEGRADLAAMFRNSAFGFGSKDMGDLGFLDALGLAKHIVSYYIPTALRVIGVTIIFIAFEIPLIGIRVKIFVTMIELCLYKLILPAAMADIALEGGRGVGMIALRRYFSIYIRIILMIAIAIIGDIAISHVIKTGQNIASAGGTVMQNALNLIIQYLCIYIMVRAEDQMMMQTAPLADAAVGIG